MVDVALFKIGKRPILSLSKGWDFAVLLSFALFFCFGQFLRLLPLPYFPSSFSVAEVFLYLVAVPRYFIRFRKSMGVLFFIVLSTLYGIGLHGFDLTSILYGIKLCAMISSAVVVGEVLAKRYSLESCLRFFMGLFSIIVLIGFGIFFVFPKAHLFFSFLDQYGIHFYGDPHERRFISSFLDPNYYAVIACLGLLITLYLRKHFLASIFLMSILLTFSRSGIATCCLLFLFFPRRWGLFLVVAILGGVLFWSQTHFFWERLLSFGEDPSALARLETWQLGIQLFWERPLFGIGYHFLAPVFEQEMNRLSTDSSFLITLIDFGLIPTLLFLGLGALWTIHSWYRLVKSHRQFFAYLWIYLMICLVFTSQFNNLLYYQYWLIPMIALFTFLTSYEKNCAGS
jgi:O-antigen ligase